MRLHISPHVVGYLWVFAALLVGARTSLAQQILDNPHPQPFANFGQAIATGDVNGDGVGDVVIAALLQDNLVSELSVPEAGELSVFDGATLTLMCVLRAPVPEPSARFGFSLAVSDLDRDGYGEIIVGAPDQAASGNSRQGRVYVFNGCSGLRYALDDPSPATFVRFGWSVASADMDNDGIPDILVHAVLQSKIYVFSGLTAAFLFDVSYPGDAGSNIGRGLQAGDTNGDEVADVVISAGTPAGEVVFVIDGITRQVRLRLVNPNYSFQTFFGHSVALADTDGDQRTEIIVGAAGNQFRLSGGQVFLFDADTGVHRLTLNEPFPQGPGNDGGFFGLDLTTGDLNADGRADLLVGAPAQDVAGHDSAGQAYGFDLLTGQLIKVFDDPRPSHRGFFGTAVSALNVRQGGNAEAVVGSPGQTVNDNTAQGQVSVFRVKNNPPVVEWVGPPPTVGSEGQFFNLLFAATDSPADIAAGLTYSWTVTKDSTPYATGTGDRAIFKADDQGTYVLTGAATDPHGATGSATHMIVVPNDPPRVVLSGSPITAYEGEDVFLVADVVDGPADMPPAALAVTVLKNGSFFSGITVPYPGLVSPETGRWLVSFTPDDNGSYQATFTATDKDGGVGYASLVLSVANVAPKPTDTIGPTTPLAMGSVASVTSRFTDPSSADTFTCTFSWDDGAQTAVTAAAGATDCSGTHAYAAAGVYTVGVRIDDDDGGSATDVFEYVVVYDPNAGFVTGGGWIVSPPGAYTVDPSATGNANFGFVSRYQRGATVPTGQTEFNFKAGSLNFHSESYDWLVVAGSKAQYKGVGTINGTGDFGFLLTVTDGNRAGGGGADKFRIKIWDRTAESVVYDNKVGASDDIDAADPQEIGGGSIVIHSN